MSGSAKPLAVFAVIAVAGTAIGWQLFDTMSQANTPVPSIVNHSEVAAEFYQVCMDAPDDTPREHFWAFQRAFCRCNTEVAVEELERTDMRLILAHKDGDEAAAEARSKLSNAELAAHVKRLFAHRRRVIPHCLEVGSAAIEAARNAM